MLTYQEAVDKTFHPKNGWNYEEASTDTEIGIWDEDNVRYFCFKGSSAFIINKKIALDWLLNFMFMPTVYKGMKKKIFIHRGFLKTYLSVDTYVMTKALEANDNNMKVVFLGFSNGSPKACLAYWKFKYLTGIEAETHGFAVPRFLFFWNSKIIKEIFKGVNIYRVNKDWVPRLPFKWMGFIDPCKIISLKAKYGFFKVEENHMSYNKY